MDTKDGSSHNSDHTESSLKSTRDALDARREYGQEGLFREGLAADPIEQLQRWIDHAATTDQLVEPTAMALATVDDHGMPSLRTVLLRRMVGGRLLFFTNYGSRKGEQIEAALQRDGAAALALLFRWANPARQVEVEGRVERATTAESDSYFASRPRGSQIGAHTSPQSRPISGREELDERVAVVTEHFDGVDQIPRPTDWGGYAVTPTAFEFWQGRSSRLHDRFRYAQDGTGWTITRLAP